MIKKLVTATVLSMLLGTPPSYAGSFVNGNQLVSDCRQNETSLQSVFCYGYIVGVFDKQSWDTTSDLRSCPPEGVTAGQTVAIVKKFLEENPENLHYDAASLVTFALAQAFPCSE